MKVLDEVNILSLDDVKAALARTIQKYGRDMTYAKRVQVFGMQQYVSEYGCLYVGEYLGHTLPLCLVGVVLVEEFQVDVENFSHNACNTTGAWSVLANEQFTVPGYDVIERKAIDFLNNAQRVQDNKQTWGEAYDESVRLSGAYQYEDAGFSETNIADAKASEEALHKHLIEFVKYDNEVKNHIYGGRKIAAIKRVREVKSCGLKEAKAAVDAMWDFYSEPPF